MEKICKIHGLTEHACRHKDTKNSRWRCRKCNVVAVSKRRKKLRLLTIEYKGGKCQLCGYNKCLGALDFHHLNPSEKEFGLSTKGFTRSLAKAKQEADKCILLCSNCHREEHWKIDNDR